MEVSTKDRAFRVAAFACPKAGNAREEYEDAWALRGWAPGDRGPAGSTRGSTRGLAAVADGATESSFSGLWAALLVETWTRGRAAGPGFFDRLGGARRLWARRLKQRKLAWFAAEKAAHGAYAAFVGVEVDTGGSWWRAAAIGDACLLHLGGGELRQAFPLERAAQFGSSPFLVGSVRKKGDEPDGHVRVAGGWFAAGEHLLLASDAMAAWLLARHEQGAPAWDEALAVEDDAGFEALVGQARGEGARNDDMTLVRITGAES